MPPRPATMTDEEIAEIEALAKGATPGPWVAEESDGYITGYVFAKKHKYHHPCVRPGLVTDPTTMTSSDAHFIARARTAVPSLVAEVRRLRKLLEAR